MLYIVYILYILHILYIPYILVCAIYTIYTVYTIYRIYTIYSRAPAAVRQPNALSAATGTRWFCLNCRAGYLWGRCLQNATEGNGRDTPCRPKPQQQLSLVARSTGGQLSVTGEAGLPPPRLAALGACASECPNTSPATHGVCVLTKAREEWARPDPFGVIL